MNDEMFRNSLIEFMNNGLLNKFVNEVFKYNLKENEYVYIQYKIVKGNIVLNIFDNSKKNRFKGYIFSNKKIYIDNPNIIYVNIQECYNKYKDKATKNKLYLIGALLKATNETQKREIINFFDDIEIKEILIKNFI